jgi:GAF domain-containing protein
MGRPRDAGGRSSLACSIDDVETDPLSCKHPTRAHYGFRSYISMPIFRGNGAFFGTLCAIDPKPAHVSRVEIVNMFRLFADLIGFHLDVMTGDRLCRTSLQIVVLRSSSPPGCRR